MRTIPPESGCCPCKGGLQSGAPGEGRFYNSHHQRIHGNGAVPGCLGSLHLLGPAQQRCVAWLTILSGSLISQRLSSVHDIPGLWYSVCKRSRTKPVSDWLAIQPTDSFCMLCVAFCRCWFRNKIYVDKQEMARECVRICTTYILSSSHCYDLHHGMATITAPWRGEVPPQPACCPATTHLCRSGTYSHPGAVHAPP